MSNLDQVEEALQTRAAAQCELCQANTTLVIYTVAPASEPQVDQCLLVCATCDAQLVVGSTLDVHHWHSLHQSIWSEVPAVQVVSWRLLQALKAHSWAQDVLDQVYLDEPTLAWARQGLREESADAPKKTLDSNGNELLEGDSVTLIKDLDVKGAGFTAKRGTTVKSIRLTQNPEHIEGRVNKTSVVLKTCFLKKL